MRKLILLIAIAGFFSQAQVQAQKLMAKDVPATVTAAFSKAHPTVTDADWKKAGNNYKANYTADKVKTCVTYDATGAMIESSVTVAASALPAPMMVYVKKNYASEDVKEGCKITSASGTVTYSAKVKEARLTFDSDGTFIKSLKKD